MPYADNNGVKIHYQVEGDGPPLVLQHGFTGSLHSWYDSSYVETLKKDHTLVLADTRGHGKSDKPYSPEEYAMDLKVADVTAIMDDLGLDRAVYMGYSLGGRAGFGVAKYAPERFDAIIIGGMHPLRPIRHRRVRKRPNRDAEGWYGVLRCPDRRAVGTDGPRTKGAAAGKRCQGSHRLFH